MPKDILITGPKPSLNWLGQANLAHFAAAEKKLVPMTGRIVSTPVKTSVDPAVAALQSQLASENAKKAENTYVDVPEERQLLELT